MSSPLFDEVTGHDLEDIPENMLRAREIIIWKKGNTNQERVEIIDFDSKKRSVEFKPTREYDFSNNDTLMINFAYQKRQYFSTGKLSVSRERTFTIELSKKVYRCEQRANFRFNASDEFKISLELGDEKYPGIDLSAGGMAIEISKDLKDRFVQGAELNAIEFQIADLIQYIPAARIAYVREFNKHKNTLCVGIEFIQLDQKTEQGLVKILNKMMYERLKKERPDFE